MTTRRRLLLAFGLGALTKAAPSVAQPRDKVWRVGYLAAITASADSVRVEAFRKRMRDLGYVEGQNVVIEYRHGDAGLDRLSEVAAELVRLKVDVLVVASSFAAEAAKRATKTVPVVFITTTDPVGLGLVKSLARPGGNITGFANLAPELAGKRLELLTQMVPRLARVAVQWDPRVSGSAQQWKACQSPARALGLRLHSMEVSTADKYVTAFADAVKARSAALAVTLNPLAVSNQNLVVDLAAKHRLPAIYAAGSFVDAGGLMSYGPSFAAAGRDAARYVDKILKGAKPADLPVEQPAEFELAINLKTARVLELTIPQSILLRADRVIE